MIEPFNKKIQDSSVSLVTRLGDVTGIAVRNPVETILSSTCPVRFWVHTQSPIQSSILHRGVMQPET